MLNLNNKRFKAISNSVSGQVSSKTIYNYFQDKNIVWATYSGGTIKKGHLIGLMNNDQSLDFHYHHVDEDFNIKTGKCHSVFQKTSSGKISFTEHWQWTCGDNSTGSSIIEEI